MNRKITLALKGMAMGMAEVIPGVSGGTIAFITGIYEELINTIKAFLGPRVWKGFATGGLRTGWVTGNFPFLLPLLFGMLAGLVGGVFGISHLLENYPPLVWSFFFGLIIASAIYVGRQVGRWSFRVIAALVLATVVSFLITRASPAQGPETWWFVFLSGAIAISALILPGVSGSFILLLLGMYQFVIGSVKEFLQTFSLEKLFILGFFAAGCLVGLASFSRVLSWMFKHHRDLTLATLTGFMIGSLNKIWPWRNVVATRVNSKGEVVPFLENNVWPAQYEGEPMLWGVVVLLLIGFLLVFLLERMGSKNKMEVGL